MARVIQTWGSSPRPVGSTMIISGEMEMAGSVSGGCVENAVIKSAQSSIQNSEGQVVHFGVSDEDAWEVGLSCGGKMSVYIQPFFTQSEDDQALWDSLSGCFENNKGAVLITKLYDGTVENTLVMPDGTQTGKTISKEISDKALEAYSERRNEVLQIDEERYFIHVFPRKHQLLIIGAAHITADLVRLSKLFDFEAVVIDPRSSFAKNNVFEIEPDQIIEKYPSEVLNEFELDAYCYTAVLSHDPKIDDNALQILLKSDVAYIGVLGSRKTHAKRMARLNALGFDDEEINAKVNAPIGLNINAKSPREIALSVMAKIIEVKNQYQ